MSTYWNEKQVKDCFLDHGGLSCLVIINECFVHGTAWDELDTVHQVLQNVWTV